MPNLAGGLMNPTIEATEADHIPTDATVCHYDELTGDAKHALPEAAANGSVEVPWRTAEQFASVDVVKFTSYYRVTITELSESADGSRVSSTSATDVKTPTHSRLSSGTPTRRTQSSEPVPK